MVSIRKHFFPGGRQKAVTLSYDDGTIHDRRLVGIMNRAGLKGSFHLNSGSIGNGKKLDPEEIPVLFKGHEISAHCVSHPELPSLSPEHIAMEILEDRRALEALAGYPVRGMSYPYGGYTEEIARSLPAFGIEYARTTKSHGAFHFPEDFLAWHPTLHHRNGLLKKTEEFLETKAGYRPRLLYVWGHSIDFERENNWDVIEAFAEKMAPFHETIWFATNIEIIDYLKALRQLRVSVDGRLVQNLSHQALWISADGQPLEIAPGELRKIC